MGRKNRGQDGIAGDQPERITEQQEFTPESDRGQDQVSDAVKSDAKGQRQGQRQGPQAGEKTQYHKPKRFGHN